MRANTTVISVRPADGQGKPQGVGKRWRGWYVGDDGKPLTRRFRTEVEAEAWPNRERAKVHTNQWVQWVGPTVGLDTFGSVAEQWMLTKAHRKPKTFAGYRSILDTLVLPGGHCTLSQSDSADPPVGERSVQIRGEGRASVQECRRRDRATPRPTRGQRDERHYLTHKQLLDLARATERFERSSWSSATAVYVSVKPPRCAARMLATGGRAVRHPRHTLHARES